MRLELSEWKRFSLGRLFDIRKGKRLTVADQEDGDNIYIGAIDSNNGVANHIGQAPIHEGNTISLSYNGSVGEAFYQPEPYWATDDVNALYPQFDGFNKYVGLFIAATIRQEKYRFSYGRKWTLDNMKITDICLPVQHESYGTPIIDDSCRWSGKGYIPDWQFMEDYIKSLHYKPLTTKNKPGSGPALNVQNWKEFQVKTLFKILNGKGITEEEIIENEGELPAVQSGEENNGVIGKIDINYCKKNGYTLVEKPCLTVARTGSAGFVSFHANGCVVGDSAKILLLDENVANTERYLFIQTILLANRFKYSYGRKVTESKYYDEWLKLPVDAAGNPDWQFMEDYIKALPYGDRLEG